MSYIDPATGQVVQTLSDIQGTAPQQTTTTSTTPTSTGGFNWSQVLGNLLNPQTVLGAGAMLGGSLMDQEPGYAVEARQALRNLFTAPQYGTGAANYLSGLYTDPQAIAKNFSGQIDALNQYYLPLIQQQENQAYNDLQTRYASMMPSSLSTAAQGAEFGALRDAAVNQFLPYRLAHMADLGRSNLDLQLRAADRMFGASNDAAGTILDYASNQNNPLAESIAQLGSILLARGLGGAGGGTGTVGGTNPLGLLQGLLGGQGGAGATLSPQLLGSLAQALGVDPQLLGQLTGAAGSALGGYFAGSGIGGALGSSQDSQLLGAGSGALSGAATGFLTGGPLGAIIGALSGGLGGFLDTREAQHAQKALFLTQDLDSQKDQVYEIGNIGGQFLQQLGATPAQIQEFTTYVNQLAATSSSPASEQDMVAQRLNQLLTPLAAARGYATLDAVPGLRSSFISYLTGSTFTSSNSAYSGGAPLNYINQWANTVGLAEGGQLPFGGMALVGERGPELAQFGPGSSVMPLNGMGMPAKAFNQLQMVMPQLPAQGAQSLQTILQGGVRQAMSPGLPNYGNAPTALPAQAKAYGVRGTSPAMPTVPPTQPPVSAQPSPFGQTIRTLATSLSDAGEGEHSVALTRLLSQLLGKRPGHRGLAYAA